MLDVDRCDIELAIRGSKTHTEQDPSPWKKRKRTSEKNENAELPKDLSVDSKKRIGFALTTNSLKLLQRSVLSSVKINTFQERH